jgi:S-DNA-T family DNA segregation ATPase FtsK/SpoIIIE
MVWFQVFLFLLGTLSALAWLAQSDKLPQDWRQRLQALLAALQARLTGLLALLRERARLLIRRELDALDESKAPDYEAVLPAEEPAVMRPSQRAATMAPPADTVEPANRPAAPSTPRIPRSRPVSSQETARPAPATAKPRPAAELPPVQIDYEGLKRHYRKVTPATAETPDLPPVQIDVDRIKRHYRSRSEPAEQKQELPVIGREELHANLQNGLKRRQTRAAPPPEPSKPLPLIDPSEVKANLRQIHSHRLDQAAPTSSVFRILAETDAGESSPQAHPPRNDQPRGGLFPSSVRFADSTRPQQPPKLGAPSLASWTPEPAPPAAAPEQIEPAMPAAVAQAADTEIVDVEIVEAPLVQAPRLVAQPIEAVRTAAVATMAPAAPITTVAPVVAATTTAAPVQPSKAMVYRVLARTEQPMAPASAAEQDSPLPWEVNEADANEEQPAHIVTPAPAASPLVWTLIEERAPATQTIEAAPAEDERNDTPWQEPTVQNHEFQLTPPAAQRHHVPVVYGDSCLPPLELLQPAELPSAMTIQSQDALLERGIVIEEKLAEFKVKVSVVDAYAGPVITRYEVEPAVGVRGNQVVNLMKDLARALGLASIRVVETIPGKTCMGLELPNPKRQMIRLSEILSAEVFQRSSSLLTMALGKDITGEPVVMDLAKAPHLLVAGTTGSGKSVGVNAMILSLLYKASPDEVRFIMIDPKMLELSVYNDIPHLLAPVVTDMKLAANALNWCVGEMEKRYRLMSALGVRNLAGFNEKVRQAEEQGRKLTNPFTVTPDNPEPLAPLPFIVVVVDEFADLMMVAGKKIEELIARLAQKARAAGIHLILATQRPSVDVITGLIKANIPTRIAFQVSSKVDSRTILDQMGAESLLGQGDMLFLPPGTGYPQRVHGAFVTDAEVHHVVEYLKQFGEPDYVEGLLTGEADADEEAAAAVGGNGKGGNEADPLYDEAVEIVLRTRKASISSVQRHLRIGYNRAARLIEEMETAGLVSAMESNGNRTVLVPERNY